MVLKKIEKSTNEIKKKKKRCCKSNNPAPTYSLQPVLGFKNHCHTKYRNPAYTIGNVPKKKTVCKGPSPNQYHPKLSEIQGYSFPKAVLKDGKSCSPGPIYNLPNSNSPAYTIVKKPKDRCQPASSGPYNPPKQPRGPAYPFGLKARERKCQINPPIRDPGDITIIKPRSPAYRITDKHETKNKCIGPGPKYLPDFKKKTPAFAFGLRYNDCMALPRTECDDLC